MPRSTPWFEYIGFDKKEPKPRTPPPPLKLLMVNGAKLDTPIVIENPKQNPVLKRFNPLPKPKPKLPKELDHKSRDTHRALKAAGLCVICKAPRGDFASICYCKPCWTLRTEKRKATKENG